jgi:hypothetical protein
MDDVAYRAKLIASGVIPDRLEELSGHQLDCVGNIVDVYRTTMRKQNPARFEILQAAAFIDSVANREPWYYRSALRQGPAVKDWDRWEWGTARGNRNLSLMIGCLGVVLILIGICS